MNELWAKLRAYLEGRTLRERWLIALAAALVGLFLCYSAVIAPLADHADQARRRSEELDSDLLTARRLASEIRALQGDVSAIEARIESASRTNLLALLETLAAGAKIQKNQIESIKPNPVAGNARYPETKVTVILRGTTLEQTIHFLHAIESADAHLIMRSLQIRKARGKGKEEAFDVTLAVSSFERA